MTNIPVIERLRGVRIETGANRPFAMDDPERVQFVERGYLDVFAVESSADEVVGRRRFVARVPAGEMAFGASRLGVPDRRQRTITFLAVPSRDAVIVEGERAGVGSENFDLTATNWIDQWASRLSDFLVRDLPPARDALPLEADPDVPYPAGAVLTAQHRDVIWVSAKTPVRFLGRHDLTVSEAEPLLPISERTWFELDTDTEVSAIHTPTAHLTEQLWTAFDRFGARVLEYALLIDAEEVDTLTMRRGEARKARRTSVNKALRGLSRILGNRTRSSADADGHAPLQRVAQLVAESCGASLEIPPANEVTGATETIESITRRARIRTRWIKLGPGWWRRSGPSMVGFRAVSDGREQPLALLSNDRGAYRAVDPATGATFAVTEKTATGIAADGLIFYASLPDRIESFWEALRFGLHRRGQDLQVAIGMGLLAGLTALLTPILTGQILVEIIPRAAIAPWIAAFGALLMVAFGNAVFEIVRGLAFLRLESRVDERLHTAIWSRLMSLPAPFFRRFTAGDLADRANGVGVVRQTLTGALMGAAAGAISAVFSLALLFYYSWLLALLVLAMLLFLAGTNGVLSLGQLRHQRAAFRAQGQIHGFVFQVISGIAKIRVANAQSYALARWVERYTEQKAESLAALRWTAGQQVLSGTFQPLSLIVIFATVHHALTGDGTSFDLASFLSFNAAFGLLIASVASVTTAATSMVGVIPLMERARPILDAEPETAGGGIDPGELKGDIEFDNVTFRYAPDSPNAADGVSFRIRQGDYAAFVGPSGCGKSTIYRLLLGFERPDSGTIFLDGHNLSSLDPARMRERIGAVLQHGQIVAGSIFENIAGMSPLSTEDAWAAARSAALEDDIRAMPMDMRTVLPEGGVGISTGQKQRLLIARAIARKPRMLLFDEATSALDNRAQARVQESLRNLGVTRLVIAHRLSSIRDVDRIYVLEAGRIVESGHYDELIRRDGVFRALSRRQLV